MALTTIELARICNVSRGTVDRALNNRPGISEQTKAKILRAAKEHGYTPHLLASSLATGKTHTIGIIIFDLKNRFFAQMVSAIQQQCLQHGIFCYICITNKDKEQESLLVNNLISRKVDGIILMPINDSFEFKESLYKMNKPIVTVNNSLDERFSFVGGNGTQAVYNGVDLFYKKGYRNVVFVCPPLRRKGEENLYAQEIRAQGFTQYLLDHPDLKGQIIASKDYAEQIIQIIQAHPNQKLGVFCGSDYYAMKVYKYAKEHNLHASVDYGLMGFDGIDALDYFDQQITTIGYPAAEIGKLSAECLFKLIDGTTQVFNILLDCPIIPGDSV